MLFKKQRQAHSRITAPAIACPHLRKKKVSLFIKFKPSETADTQASIAAKVDAENAATTAQTPSQFPSEAGTITRGASISHGAKRKNQKQCPKARLVRQPADFFCARIGFAAMHSPPPRYRNAQSEKKVHYCKRKKRPFHYVLAHSVEKRSLPHTRTKCDSQAPNQG